VPRTQPLTAREAAGFLGVSRPAIVKLLEDGKIPMSSQGAAAGSCSPTPSASTPAAAPPWTG